MFPDATILILICDLSLNVTPYLWNMWFIQQWVSNLLCSGMWHHVGHYFIWQISTITTAIMPHVGVVGWVGEIRTINKLTTKDKQYLPEKTMTLYMGTIVSWGDSILKVKVQFSSQIYWPTSSHYRRQCTCSLADGCRHFMETCCLHLQGEVYAKTNAACSSKIYQTAYCHMTKYCNFYIGYLLVTYYNFPGTAILQSHKLH